MLLNLILHHQKHKETGNSVFQIQQGSCMYELRGFATTGVRPVQVQVREIPTWGGEVGTKSRKLLATESQWETERHFSLIAPKVT